MEESEDSNGWKWTWQWSQSNSLGIWQTPHFFVYLRFWGCPRSVSSTSLDKIRRNRLSDGYLHYKMDKPKHQGLCTATDQSTQCAGFGSAKKQQPGEKLSIYSSPPPQTNNPRGTENDFVQLFLNNIEPGNKKGLVAEMRKDFGGVELKEIFYNPPQVLVQPNAVDVSVQGSRVGLNETNSKR